MATFPKPLCELRALWGERQSGVSRPASCPAGMQTPSSATTHPLAGKPEGRPPSKVEDGAKSREGE